MAYTYDEDLEFLGEMKSKDLEDLFYCLTRGKDGSVRLTEELTYSDAYKKYKDDYHQYWELIAGELQCFGANTFATLLRGGKGVMYREVLTDVCKKIKVEFNPTDSVEQIEESLLIKILTDSYEDMTPNERAKLVKITGLENLSSKRITKKQMVSAFRAIFKQGGFQSYQLTVIVANAVMRTLFGRGLSLTTNATITQSMAIFIGPVGSAFMACWTLLDIASPAYRVTVPSVIQVAVLRQKYLYEKNETEDLLTSALVGGAMLGGAWLMKKFFDNESEK